MPKSHRTTSTPHFFTEQEIKDFFDACDSLPINPHHKLSISRKISIPVFFRLLYSSGLRPIEARLLKANDIDLKSGIVNIRESKGYNQHFTVLHDSMLELIKQYDVSIRELYPNRTYFFPAEKDGHHTMQWVISNFNKLWNKKDKPLATAYAFRHHYAITNINSWINEGFGFDDKLLYLSKSMGHGDIKSTKYYYSLTPSLSDILYEKTNADFEDIVPEAEYEEVEQ